MAISNKFVNYSKQLEVPIYAPKSYNEKTGKWVLSDEQVATYSMVSARSVDGRAAVKKATSDLAKLQASLKKKQDDGGVLDFDDIDSISSVELNRVAACIMSWDWTDEYFEGEGKPELSVKEAVRIFKDADWIFQQVEEVPNNLGNFTNK